MASAAWRQGGGFFFLRACISDPTATDVRTHAHVLTYPQRASPRARKVEATRRSSEPLPARARAVDVAVGAIDKLNRVEVFVEVDARHLEPVEVDA